MRPCTPPLTRCLRSHTPTQSTGSLDEVSADDVAGGEVDEVVQNLALRITEVRQWHRMQHHKRSCAAAGMCGSRLQRGLPAAALPSFLLSGRVPTGLHFTPTTGRRR